MRRLLFVLAFALLPITAVAQVSAPTTIELKDEGTSQGRVRTLNCVGGSIACTTSGFDGTLTLTGGGSGVASQYEANFTSAADCTTAAGTPSHTPGFNVCVFTVSNASIGATSRIAFQQSQTAATSRQADENEMDPIECRVTPGVGVMTVTCRGLEGPIQGRYKFDYIVF